MDAVVNAVTAARPPGSGPFGGGDLADADLAAFRGWTVAVAEQAFVFLSPGAGGVARERRRQPGADHRRLLAPRHPREGSVGGRGVRPARAGPGRAQELRSDGIHVALLAVDATIESPKTEAFTRDQPADALADMGQIASAVSFLVDQGARALTHELVVTPAGERWVP